MDKPEDILRNVIQVTQNQDYYSAVTEYDLLMKQYPGFVERLFKNQQNRELHELLARHSLIQQAYGSISGCGYEVDISTYLGGPGRIRMPQEFSKPLADFKGNRESFNTDKELVLQRYSQTLQAVFGKLAKVDWSPVYLGYWVLDDFFKIRAYFPLNFSKVLDLGCGIGSINILIDQIDGNEKIFTIIDIKKEFLEVAEGFLTSNQVSASTKTQSVYDVIISLRSCCYLYSYKEYESVFLEQTRKGSSIILDISPELLSESLSFFKSFCEYSIPIESGSANFHRYAFIR
ncbi:MAG: methyltransferase [Rhodospirillaceae bacterium]